MNNPRSFRYVNNHALNRSGRWSLERSGYPYNREHGSCSQFSTQDRPIPRNKSDKGSWNRNPNLRNRLFCYRCDSPDHISRDRKCTPTLIAIKTNLIVRLEWEDSHADMKAEDLLTLHVTHSSRWDSTADKFQTKDVNTTLERHEDPALKLHNPR